MVKIGSNPVITLDPAVTLCTVANKTLGWGKYGHQVFRDKIQDYTI